MLYTSLLSIIRLSHLNESYERYFGGLEFSGNVKLAFVRFTLKKESFRVFLFMKIKFSFLER